MKNQNKNRNKQLCMWEKDQEKRGKLGEEKKNYLMRILKSFDVCYMMSFLLPAAPGDFSNHLIIFQGFGYGFVFEQQYHANIGYEVSVSWRLTV